MSLVYNGDVLEDLKQIGGVLSELSRQYPNNEEFKRYPAAANHALQILDRNRRIVNAYELETRTGMQSHREPDSIVPSPAGCAPGKGTRRF